MPDHFDPYYRWLGIPPDQQPPNHYRLLGISLFESEREVIRNAADQRMSYLKTFGAGRHSELSQKLLNEVSAAKVYLLNEDKKRAYDDYLHMLTDSDRPAEELPIDQASHDGSYPRSNSARHDATVDIKRSPVGRRRRARPFARRKWPVIALATLFVCIVGIVFWPTPSPSPGKTDPGKAVGHLGNTGHVAKEDHEPLHCVISTFDDNADDWQCREGARASMGAEWQRQGGNPGGCVRFVDPQHGETWYWIAPTKFHGAKQDFYGRYFRFDIRTDHVDREYFCLHVELRGGVGNKERTLICDTMPEPGAADTWMPYSVRLDPTAGWTTMEQGVAGEADIRAVLDSVRDIRIQGEFSRKKDTGYLDNVVFGGPASSIQINDVEEPKGTNEDWPRQATHEFVEKYVRKYIVRRIEGVDSYNPELHKFIRVTSVPPKPGDSAWSCTGLYQGIIFSCCVTSSYDVEYGCWEWRFEKLRYGDKEYPSDTCWWTDPENDRQSSDNQTHSAPK